MKLGVNIDHIATLREARFRQLKHSNNREPDILFAAQQAVAGGADLITIHVREDKRHIQAEDAFLLKKSLAIELNLEMSPTLQMLELAKQILPAWCCLVPESREEVTTEGGLNVVTHFDFLKPIVQGILDSDIRVSLFVDPKISQIEAASLLEVSAIELHTGAFAESFAEGRIKEMERLKTAAKKASELGLEVHAGHGINYDNVGEIVAIPYIKELNIGHSIISKSISIGLMNATKEMKDYLK